jgi:hypothetical protein
LAARDYEDLLQVSALYGSRLTTWALTSIFQCAIPVFDGLLPEPHNTAIINLLYLLAFWHSLAKLRLHTDLTLDVMDKVTVALGNALRAFSTKTCAAFDTHELKRETEARNRRELMKQQRRDSSSSHLPSSSSRHTVGAKQGPGARQPKKLNLNTYKVHALGDYVNTIRTFGTTDSYSTETVCTRSRPIVFIHEYKSIRANSSTAHQKLGTFAPVGRTISNR